MGFFELLACESSHPSSLPPEWRFTRRKRHSAGSEEGRLFSQAIELCVHQCTQISDWLRALKRQSNVNLYLSSFPREKGLLSNTLLQIESAIEETHRGSFGFSEYPRGKQKNYTKGRTGERFRGMVCKMGLTRLHDFYGS